MKTQHTPGPLRIETYSGDNGTTELYRLQAQVGVTADGILKREDAELYAAAPDLLDVLRAFTNCGAGTDGDKFWEDYDGCCDAALRVIAKATQAQ